MILLVYDVDGEENEDVEWKIRLFMMMIWRTLRLMKDTDDV